MGTHHEVCTLADTSRSRALFKPRGANDKSQGTFIRNKIVLLSLATLNLFNGFLNAGMHRSVNRATAFPIEGHQNTN